MMSTEQDMSQREFIDYLCKRGLDEDNVHKALTLAETFDFSWSGEMLEVAIMHLASVVDPRNEFANNSNLQHSNSNRYIEHISIIMSSDINSWCKKFYESAFWRYSNPAITNIVWNWLQKSLSNPSIFV